MGRARCAMINDGASYRQRSRRTSCRRPWRDTLSPSRTSCIRPSRRELQCLGCGPASVVSITEACPAGTCSVSRATDGRPPMVSPRRRAPSAHRRRTWPQASRLGAHRGRTEVLRPRRPGCALNDHPRWVRSSSALSAARSFRLARRIAVAITGALIAEKPFGSPRLRNVIRVRVFPCSAKV
jgi:hypothetical protein